MKIARLSCLSLVPCLVLALAGCKEGEETDAAEGTETGGDGDGDSNQGEASCGEETESVLDDLFATPPGFAMPLNEVLAQLEGNFEGTFTWYPAEGGWGSTYAGTESPLTAAMAYSGGTVRLVEVEKHGMLPDGEGDGMLCSNYVVIDVVLEFATEDGVFAESWVVPLTISASDEGLAPSIYASIDLGALMGTLDTSDILLDAGTLTDVVLTGWVNSLGMTGDLNIEVEVGEGPDGIVGFGSIGHFDSSRVL